MLLDRHLDCVPSENEHNKSDLPNLFFFFLSYFLILVILTRILSQKALMTKLTVNFDWHVCSLSSSWSYTGGGHINPKILIVSIACWCGIGSMPACWDGYFSFSLVLAHVAVVLSKRRQQAPTPPPHFRKWSVSKKNVFVRMGTWFFAIGKANRFLGGVNAEPNKHRPAQAPASNWLAVHLMAKR